MTSLLDVTPSDARERIAAWVHDRGEPAYRVRQILPRLWQRPIRSWNEASDLPEALRSSLDEHFPLPVPTLLKQEVSSDGTIKFLWQFGGTAAVESVWIPQRRRSTLCISSQEGCAYGCRFCATGTMGFLRHLTPSEIAGQVREMLLVPELGRPTNIVFMGMGEPLHNWPAVDTALTILNDPDGLGIGARHITISTIGIVPALAKLAARPEQFGVAWSLHAAVPESRAALMPIEQKYPMQTVQRALRAFSRRITVEDGMIDGVNDDEASIDALAAIASDLKAHVNLLPLHPGGADDLHSTNLRDMRAFAKALQSRRVNVTVRPSRGLDIKAACGQLRATIGGVRIASKK